MSNVSLPAKGSTGWDVALNADLTTLDNNEIATAADLAGLHTTVTGLATSKIDTTQEAADVAALQSSHNTTAADLAGLHTTVSGLASSKVDGTQELADIAAAKADAATRYSKIRPWEFSVLDYGAKGDGRIYMDAGINSLTNVLNLPSSAPFTPQSVNQWVIVHGAAGVGVVSHVAQITQYISPSSVTLSLSAAVTVTGARVLIATGDRAAFQNCADAAYAWAVANSKTATILVPPPTGGQFYGIDGQPVTGGTTKGNAQITLPNNLDTLDKNALRWKGFGIGCAVPHWNATVPQFSGSTLVSFLPPFSGPGAQSTAINANGYISVIGGPTPTNGYGQAPGVFSNLAVDFEDITILVPHTTYGLHPSGIDGRGIANLGLRRVGIGTTGTVAGNDFANSSLLGTGLCAGVLMPASGNNDRCMVDDVTISGFTYGLWATEHTYVTSIRLLYHWAGLVAEGTYWGSVGATHGIVVNHASIEACSRQIYLRGQGSEGYGPFLTVGVLDTESANPTIDADSAGTMAAALGHVTWFGMFDPSLFNLTYPACGMLQTNGKLPNSTRTTNAAATLNAIDRTLGVDASGGNLTVSVPTAVSAPMEYRVVKKDATANTVTLNAASGETIGGTVGTYVLNTPGQHVTLSSIGGVWYPV
jgi:hypothetical protein